MNCFGNIKLKMRLRDGRDQSNTTQLKIPVNNLAKGCGTVKLRLIAKLLSCRPQIINLAKGCT